MVTRLLIRVDAGYELPIYRQIVEQVKAAIASGVLAPGDQLPSHRDLARDLVVAPLTVSRAYELLEREGFVATARGKGTFVTTAGSDAASHASKELRERANALVRHAQALGLRQRDVLDALQRAWRDGKEKP